MTRILLTGGSGFVGKNISTSDLANHYTFLTPSHAELDLLDENGVQYYFKHNDIDIVIHSATKPGHRNAKDLTSIFYSDMRFLFTILQNHTQYKKLLILGSGGIYDNRYYTPKMKENDYHHHIPKDEHGFFRYCSAKYLEHISDVIELRIFGLFGKYEDYAIRFISNAICKSLFNLPITIKCDRYFDYLYIDDLLPILTFFIEQEVNEKAYNITPDTTIKLSDIASIIKRITNNPHPIKINSAELGLEYSGDNTLLHKTIPNLFFTPIEKSITLLYEWYRDNIQIIKRDLLLFDK